MSAAARTRAPRHGGSPRYAAAIARGGRRRWWVWALVAALLILAGWAVWLGTDAVRANRELRAAAGLVSTLQERVMAGDHDAVDERLDEVQRSAAAAYDATRGPHWSAARVLPWVGNDVAVVQTAAGIVNTLATEVLPDLAEVAVTVEPAALVPRDGRVDLAPLVAAQPVVVGAAHRVDTARAELGGLPDSGLLPMVADARADLDQELADLAMLTATAARAVQLLPPMLGADGERRYLVLVQNPAEPRATGGVPVLVLLTADDGVVEVTEQRSAVVGNLTDPVLPLTDAELSLFSPLLGAYMADVTFTPDFPRSGELAQAIWEAETGETVDGVLSIEPGALGLILEATGPVTTATGEVLTAETAPSMLMNTVYIEEPEKAERDEFFLGATTAIFDAVMGSQWEPPAMVDALAQAAREDRLMVWSSHEAEQALLMGTVLSGELRGHAGDSSVIGLYVNAGTQSKIGYYLGMDVTATTTHCFADGSQEVVVRVELTSTVPADSQDLPDYVIGSRERDRGLIRGNLLVYAPTDGVVQTVEVIGLEPGVLPQRHNGFAVVGKTFVLEPGQEATLEYTIRTGPDQQGPVLLRATPLASGAMRIEGMN